MSERFRRTAERVLDGMLGHSPEWATELGDHRFDDRLSDLSDAGVAERVAMLHDGTAVLDDLDETELDVDARVDLEILRAALIREAWRAEELAVHRHDPLLHLPGDALHPLLEREGPDPAHRLTALTARLAAVPNRLSVARAVLKEMPRVHVETAVAQTRGIETSLDQVGELADLDPGSAPALRAARDAAALALREHATWLEAQLPVSDGDPRLGPERYAAQLWYTVDNELGPDALLTRAESDLQAVEEEIAEVASRIAGAPPRPGQVREVLDRIAAEAPVDDSTVLPLCQAALAGTTDRVRELELVSVPDDLADVVRIVVMPPARRGVAVAYCEPPGPLDPAAGTEPSFFAVSPTPDDWSADRVASFYREYNGHMLRNLTVHEAMPGHVLQLAHSARHRGATRVRRALWSGTFVEGWANYSEELMARAGSGTGDRAVDDALTMMQLKMRLRSTINAILDVRVHAHGMTRDEAMTLMIERGHQEEGEAVGKWRRALLTSAQLTTYYVGVVEVSDIVRALRRHAPGSTERQVHDAVLAHGSPPPRHLRALLGLDDA